MATMHLVPFQQWRAEYKLRAQEKAFLPDGLLDEYHVAYCLPAISIVTVITGNGFPIYALKIEPVVVSCRVGGTGYVWNSKVPLKRFMDNTEKIDALRAICEVNERYDELKERAEMRHWLDYAPERADRLAMGTAALFCTKYA